MNDWCKIITASDGEAVLFVIDIEHSSGLPRVQGVTRAGPNGERANNAVMLDDMPTAQRMFDLLDLSSADAMRQAATELPGVNGHARIQ